LIHAINNVGTIAYARFSMKPSIGCIVHYHSTPGSDPQAAFVVHVWTHECVNLSYCNSSGTWSAATSVPFEASATHTSMSGGRGAFWRWPLKV